MLGFLRAFGLKVLSLVLCLSSSLNKAPPPVRRLTRSFSWVEKSSKLFQGNSAGKIIPDSKAMAIPAIYRMKDNKDRKDFEVSQSFIVFR